MTEHLCVIDQRRQYERAQVCGGCRLWLDRTLIEIVELYALLPDAIGSGEPLNAGEWTDERGVKHLDPVALAMPVGTITRNPGQRVSGSREAPLPLRVDPLDLMMPAPTGRQMWTTVHDTWRDQTGQVSVATLLDSWARDWRDVRDRGEGLPPPGVVELRAWLRNRLEWACDEHPAVDEFAGELRDLVRVLRVAVGHIGTQPELKSGVPCRECDRVTLFRKPASDYIECGSCGVLLTPEEYDRWTSLISSPEWVPWVRQIVVPQREEVR